MTVCRLQVASDLHLEFHRAHGRAVLEEGIAWDASADALVLAGDVATADDEYRTLGEALRRLAGRFPQVLFVPGNHDLYGAEAPAGPDVLRCVAAGIDGVTMLEPGVVAEVNGRRVIGATLWFPESAATRRQERKLTDFTAIGGFKPWVYEQNRAHVAWLDAAMRKRDVVVTHHLPATGSVTAKFAGNPLNCYFLCDLSPLILERGPALWVHGHTHLAVDHHLGSTRIAARPYGYPGEQGTPYEPLVIELPTA